MNVELLPQIFDKESLSNFVIDELKKILEHLFIVIFYGIIHVLSVRSLVS